MLSKVSKVTASIMGVGALAILANISLSSVFADNPSPADADFEVNVKEALSVSITVPEDWATGDVGTLLRNKITLNVHSNNANGFTASMTTNTTDTNLAHTTIETTTGSTTIPTLSADWTRSDTATTNFWGYSLNDDNEAGTYSPLVGLGSGPITLISRTDSIDATNPITSRDIYFGAKADTSKVAGTYSNTVVISVVSGMVAPDDPTNPVIPVDPVTPTSNPGDNATASSDTSYGPTYSSTYNRTAYTTTSTDSDTTTTTTNINEGNVVGSYETPQGVKNPSDSSDSSNSGLTTALAVTAGVAAGAGTLFFILAKRKKDEEEE